MGNARSFTTDMFENHPDYHAGSVWQDALRNAHCSIGKITFKRRASSRILTEFNVTTNRLRAAQIRGEKRHA